MFVRLRLRELLESRGMIQAELGRRTGLSEDRVSRLVRNAWVQITKDELGQLLHTLRATPGELFEVHEPTVFFGAQCQGSLKIHVSSRWLLAGDGSAGRPHQDDGANPPLSFNMRDIEALQLIQDHTRELGVDSRFQIHTPGSMDAARFLELVETDNHVIIGSNLTGELSEYALAHMYAAPAFDEYYLERFPFNFSWGVNRSVESSFGFEGAKRNLPEGIYSAREKRIVATRTHRNVGTVRDCGLIAVYRVESPVGDDASGIRRERCVIVLAGHGRHGTLGCARLLVDPDYRERLYPEEARTAKMFAVQVQHLLQPPYAIPEQLGGGALDRVEIVAEA